MLRALIFDFDGTILETETPDFQTWQEIFRNHGAELPLDVWLQCVGGATGAFDPYSYLEEALGRDIERKRLRAERRTRFLELVHAQPVMPGVLKLIAAAEQRGLKLAVASSSDRDWVESNLQRLDLRRRFAAVLTADDVERVKPDPALYRRAAQALDVSPRQAVAIEDSYNGMLGAKRAGLRCISVPNRITRSSDFSAADLCLDSIASIAPADLFAYFDDPTAGQDVRADANGFDRPAAAKDSP